MCDVSILLLRPSRRTRRNRDEYGAILEDNFSFRSLNLSLNVRVSSVIKMEGKRQWQTQSKPKHEETRTQTQAHQPKKL